MQTYQKHLFLRLSVISGIDHDCFQVFPRTDGIQTNAVVEEKSLWMNADASLFPVIDARHVRNYGCDFPVD